MTATQPRYQDFIESKRRTFQPCGFEPEPVNPMLFDFQADLVRWAIRKGRAGLFEDCGLGKTPQQLEWARQVARHTGLPVLIFAPLSVSLQTQREGLKFGIPVTICRMQADLQPGVNITNYEKLEHFSPEGLGGVVLDESSILKGFDGSTRKALTAFASSLPYRLCCTATPAPNDYMELGNHAEFLGVMTLQEMLATFFVHDGGETSKWRLKGHAQSEFWKWVCSWAVALRRPSDIGYDDGKFKLPELRMHQITVPTDLVEEGLLFPVEAKTLQERRGARKASLEPRVKACADIVNADHDAWLIWCNLNAESAALTRAVDSAVEVTGSDSDSHKETSALKFAAGEIDRLVSKPVIFGYGMNFQACHKVAFVGLSDSYEQFYQAIRRCWRFGQEHPVDCYVIVSETEGAVVRNIERKEREATEMMEGMVQHMKFEMQKQVHGAQQTRDDYATELVYGKGWKMRLGDCVEQIKAISDESVHFSIFSPPFASLYTYTASDRDMGNCRTHAEFYEHFRFLLPELFRILKPGRLVSFHCMNLPMSKERDGVIGIWDFRGELVRLFAEAGFVFHSEVCIWKDPVTAMQRTKALGLLHKQIRKDSCMSRQGIPDYLVTMRKPGDNPERVEGLLENYVGDEGTGPTATDPVGRSIEIWQRYASPVWMDINPSNTLQKESAREHADERHICPLQLQVIERALELWTNEGDTVFSPFAGIGSEGYVSLQRDRKFIGIELKRSYFNQAVANLIAAERSKQGGLFSELMGTAMRDADAAAEEYLRS